MKHKNLESISTELQNINESFHSIVHPYRSSLWNYCKGLTGSPWDAEDLLQETMLKAFSSLTRIQQTINPKSYLFRIASNTWLDYCRKSKMKLEELELEQIYEKEAVSFDEVSDAIETLIHHLPAKQACVVLLMEIYQFTANETAEIINTTEGAVYSLLNRARSNLKKLHKIKKDIHNKMNISLSEEQQVVIQHYMDSFVKGDFQTIGTLLADYATNEIVGQGMDIGKKQIRKNSIGDWGNSGSDQTLSAELINLWDKPAVIFTKQTESGPVLWDITTVVIENGSIVRHKSYYFCKDFLKYAAEELHLKLDEDKDLFGVKW